MKELVKDNDDVRRPMTIKEVKAPDSRIELQTEPLALGMGHKLFTASAEAAVQTYQSL